MAANRSKTIKTTSGITVHLFSLNLTFNANPLRSAARALSARSKTRELLSTHLASNATAFELPLLSTAVASDPLEQALKNAELVDMDGDTGPRGRGGILLSDLAAAPGGAGTGRIDFSVESSEPVLAVSYTGSHIQVVRRDPRASNDQSSRFSLEFGTDHPAMGVSNLGRSLSLDLSSLTQPIVRFFKYVGKDIFEGAAEKLTQAIAEYIERNAKQREQLLRFAIAPKTNDPLFVVPDQNYLASFEGNTGLLLIHGIFSSIPGAFAGLAKNVAFMDRLGRSRRYQGRAIGWDHWTVSEDAQTNAVKLVGALPSNTTFDLVCHSRGGLVTRYLLEDPGIAGMLAQKKIRFGKVVFVASAYWGDPLAKTDNNLLKVLNAMITIGQLVPVPVVQDLTVVLKVITALAHDIQDLPGIKCLDPIAVSKFAWSPKIEQAYYSAWANFALEGKAIDDGIDAVVSNVLEGISDFVVPYSSAGLHDVSLAEPITIVGSLTQSQHDVHHVNYFTSPKSPVPDMLVRVLMT